MRTYVVTGAASGIGAATAELIRERGHKVIGVDLRDADVTADLSTAEGRQSAVSRTLELSEGKIDAVIAAAGISAPKAVRACQVDSSMSVKPQPEPRQSLLKH